MMSAVLTQETSEALKKAGVVWIAVDGAAPRVVWHLWHAGCLWTVVGGGEQQLPGAPAGRHLDPAGGCVVQVTVRDAHRQGLPAFPAALSVVEPGSPLWDEVAPLLHATRLNAVDGEQQPARWARESVVVRLEPLPSAPPSPPQPR